jgi:hypothetical protein
MEKTDNSSSFVYSQKNTQAEICRLTQLGPKIETKRCALEEKLEKTAEKVLFWPISKQWFSRIIGAANSAISCVLRQLTKRKSIAAVLYIFEKGRTK